MESYIQTPIGTVTKALDMEKCETTLFTTPKTNVILYHPKDTPDTIQLAQIHVAPIDRGKGIASALFELAIDHAKREGYGFIQTVAANERTAKLFDRFDANDVLIATWNVVKKEYEPEDMTLDESVDYLKHCRAISGPTQRPDSLLEDSVAITVRLT